MQTEAPINLFGRLSQSRRLIKPDGGMLSGCSQYPYGSVVVCLSPGRPWEDWCQNDLGVEPGSSSISESSEESFAARLKIK